MPENLYQLEVKLGLARFPFQASAGWRLTMHVDAMERAKGGTHPRGKIRRANAALRQLRELGVTIGPHKLFGPVDVVAEHASSRVLASQTGNEGEIHSRALPPTARCGGPARRYY